MPKKPLRFSLDLDDYSQSALPGWFRLDNWTAREGICLLCDIDPNTADISWGDNSTSNGPKIKNAQLLSKDITYWRLDRNYPSSLWEKYGAPWGMDPNKIQDEDSLWAYQSAEKELELDCVQDSLQELWRIFSRANDTKLTIGAGASPQWFVNWAIKRKIEIPWLDWAISSGHISDTPNSTPSARTPKKSRRQSEEEVQELRTAANKEAARLLREGLPKKRITLKKICTTLLSSGSFSNGLTFRSRWGTFEGMRSHLQKEHHPKKSALFLNAKPDRGNQFNK